MAALPPEGAQVDPERRRRTVVLALLAVVVLILILVFSMCSSGDDDGDAAPATMQATTGVTPTAVATTSPPESESSTTTTSVATTATSPATNASSPATTIASSASADPYDFTNPREISIEWTCMEPAVMGNGAFGTTCLNRSRGSDVVFNQSNFGLGIDYTTGADGDLAEMDIYAWSWGNCFWNPPDVEKKNAPIVDGTANHSGVLLGEGLCESAQWAWESTWDVESHILVTTGVLGPVS